MSTSKVEYLGDLRTKCTHFKSGTEIITDAPTDNNGKGEAFSPTDLVATSLASCMFTIIGIYCNQHNINFKHGVADITKIMASSPRRISELLLKLDLSGNDWDEVTQNKIVQVAKACPVAKSIHEDIQVTFEYNF